MRAKLLTNGVVVMWLTGFVALIWAVDWVQRHWDHSPYGCSVADTGALSCGRTLSGILFGVGLVVLIVIIPKLATKLTRH